MSVKTRIFLWVSFLFVLTWASFFLVGHYEMKVNIEDARRQIRNEIAMLNRDQQQHIERYLRLELGKMQAHTANVLTRVGEYQDMLGKFMPTEVNYKQNTWLSSSVVLAGSPEIDLIQCVNQGKLTSLIMIDQPYVVKMAKVPLSKDVSLIVQGFSDGKLDIYIGVPYWKMSAERRANVGLAQLSFTLPENADFWLLFSIDSMLKSDYSNLHAANVKLPTDPMEMSIYMKNNEVFRGLIQETIERMKKTQQAIHNDENILNKLQSPDFVDWVKTHIENIHDFDGITGKQCIETICRSSSSEISTGQYEQMLSLSNRYEAKHLIWELATIIGSGIWNFDPFDPSGPQGLVRFNHHLHNDTQIGTGIWSTDVFYPYPFEISEVCDPLLQRGSNTCIEENLRVFHWGEENNPLYFGNSMSMVAMENGKERRGMLAMAMNGDDVLRQIAVAIEESVYFITGNAVIKAFGPDGQEIPTNIWSKINLDQVLSNFHGVIRDDRGNEYFYTHNVPFRNDMHFVVFRLKENEFKMFKELNVRTEAFAHRVSLQLGIIALGFLIVVMVALDRVLKKLTTPIVELSCATKEICDGKLENVFLDKRNRLGNDEIGDLYNSFAQMVDSMREGEKAKGLLNKAVSKKIAHKIMTSDVHLGGERRDVTVLFSDIRNFTSLSEQMEPEDLLALLNDYLSRMTRFVDQYEGVIDKYMGDEIMALFGAPLDLENAPTQAVLCAIDMMEDLKHWNLERQAKGERILEIGTGINTGMVVAGNIGSGDRLNYTVLGHVVNVAERLCSVAKGMEIIVCKTTLERMEDPNVVLAEEQEPLSLKGVSRVVANYRIFGRARPGS